MVSWSSLKSLPWCCGCRAGQWPVLVFVLRALLSDPQADKTVIIPAMCTSYILTSCLVHHYTVAFGAGSEKRAVIYITVQICDCITGEQQWDNLTWLVGAGAIGAVVQAVLTQRRPRTLRTLQQWRSGSCWNHRRLQERGTAWTLESRSKKMTAMFLLPFSLNTEPAPLFNAHV